MPDVLKCRLYDLMTPSQCLKILYLNILMRTKKEQKGMHVWQVSSSFKKNQKKTKQKTTQQTNYQPKIGSPQPSYDHIGIVTNGKYY